MFHYPMIVVWSTFAFLGKVLAQQNPLASSPSSQEDIIVIRDASIADVDDITHVVLDAFSTNELYRYTYQFKDQYPQYHFECARRQIHEVFENLSSDVLVKVIETPASAVSFVGRNKQARKSSKQSRPSYPYGIVAVAVWDNVTRTRSSHGFGQHEEQGPGISLDTFLTNPFHGLTIRPSLTTPDCSANLDVNQTRDKHISRQLSAAKIRYIDQAYSSQLYLHLLTTHPQWDSHGFGPANLRWGMEESNRRGVPLTLLSTPAGYTLYNQQGFKSIANITFSDVEGKSEPGFWLEVMEWMSESI